MGAGIAAAAHVRVVAAATPATGGLVEVEAHGLDSARFPVGVSRRTLVLRVVGARTNGAVRLGEARESDCPQF